nr:unnamed protein product [Digitaria exilis]
MPEANAGAPAQAEQRKKNSPEMDFFSEYGDANRYKIQEIIGKGSYGVVCSAIDQHTGEKVAIKKIQNIFEHLSDAARILREIKLLRLLRHPDIVEIKHVMLPPSRRDFRDIYVVFELMDTDLHQVIKANDDLTREHHQFFLYQMLRALKYIHTEGPTSNLSLTLCTKMTCRTMLLLDGTGLLSCVGLSLLRSFSLVQYSPAIDMWSIGCIFAEILTGKPLFPGKNVVHQLDLMTDLLGTPSGDTISLIRNEKARRYLGSMRRKQSIPFSEKFPNADPSALKLLQRLLAFDPKDRPTAEEALADPYFKGIAKVEREPSCQPISKMEFEFERRKFTKEDVKELIFQEILEYHPQLLKDYKNGSEKASFLYPSAVDNFRRQFANLEENGGRNATSDRKHVSLPRTTTVHSTPIPAKEGPAATSQAPQRLPTARPGRVVGPVLPFENSSVADQHITRRVARNPAVPPATNNSSACCYHLKSDSSDRQEHQLELEKDRMQYRPGQHSMEAKVAPDMTRDMRPSLYYVSRGVPKADLTDRVALQRSMLHTAAPFNGMTAVGGGYSKAGVLHYGVTSLY